MKSLVRTIVVLSAFVFAFGCENAAPGDPAGTGCCAVAGGCASGQGVSEDACTGELNGTWEPGKECDPATGCV